MIRQLLERVASSLFGRPRFIRVISGKKEDWENGSGVPEELAAHAFSRKRDRISVFKVSTDIEEARAVAAFHLNRKNTPSQPVLAARLFRKELEKAGIAIEKLPGRTGVSDVDQAHYDLIGDGKSYTTLVTLVLAAQRRGENRVRRLTKRQLFEQFRSLLNEDNRRTLSDVAQSQCERFVEKMEASIK